MTARILKKDHPMTQGREVEPMGDEELAEVRELISADPFMSERPTREARLLSRLHRAEKDRDAKAEALSGLYAALNNLAERTSADVLSLPLGSMDRRFKSGQAAAYRSALRLVGQALTTPPTEEESA